MSASIRKSRVGCIMCRKLFDIKSSLLSVSLTCRANVPVIKNPNPLVIFADPNYVEYLARHFTIKLVPATGVNYDAGKSYELEARATFFATSKPSTNYALAFINVLRRDFGEQYGHLPPPSKLQHGIQR
ncbi:hypothetical protein ACSS6W_004218 [Trichoderma asperelloides]